MPDVRGSQILNDEETAMNHGGTTNIWVADRSTRTS
jgi:hypothetical protein